MASGRHLHKTCIINTYTHVQPTTARSVTEGTIQVIKISWKLLTTYMSVLPLNFTIRSLKVSLIIRDNVLVPTRERLQIHAQVRPHGLHNLVGNTVQLMMQGISYQGTCCFGKFYNFIRTSMYWPAEHSESRCQYTEGVFNDLSSAR